MRKVLKVMFVFLFFLSLVSCVGNKNNFSVEDYMFFSQYGVQKPKGDVKYIRAKIFDAEEKFGEVQRGDLYGTIDYHFNKDNRIKEKSIYHGDGELLKKIIIHYDNNDLLQNWAFYDGDGSLEDETIVNYDKDNRITLLNVYDNKHKLESKIHFKYESKDSIKVDYINVKDNKSAKDTIQLKDGLIVKVAFNSGKEVGYTSSEYNDKGDIINMIRERNGIKITYRFVYEYDLEDNWIRKITYEDNKLDLVNERVIEYY